MNNSFKTKPKIKSKEVRSFLLKLIKKENNTRNSKNQPIKTLILPMLIWEDKFPQKESEKMLKLSEIKELLHQLKVSHKVTPMIVEAGPAECIFYFM
jgi:hypothetical protein